MTNAENSSKLSTKKVISMKQHGGCSFPLNETHEKEESPQDSENVSHLKRNTPILFSTNRGLHLRMATTTTTISPHKASLTSTNTTGSITKINSNYSMQFCDLERWSTNRANTISLEDTFTIPKSTIVTGSRASNNLRFLPNMQTTVRSNGYSRFDVE